MSISSRPGIALNQPRASTGERRLDIQGLRAVAVLMIIAYHAGLPIPGGFVSLDVFFVISGFVITAMLRREWLKHGRIRLGTFYLRRFKRLTPALALVVAVTMPVAALILSPFDTQPAAAKTGIGAMLLVANIVIIGATGEYFDPPAERNPLLHTWSLSVEEQFYLVFPMMMIVAWLLVRGGRLRRAPIIVVGTVAFASLGLAVAESAGLDIPSISPLLGYYGPLTRAWEFAAGALLFLVAGRLRAVRSAAAGWLAGAGAGMIIVPCWLISESTPYPGPWTLAPVLGTLLLIHAGTSATNPVTRALTVRPLVTIGDWSYSIYLWHWPFIVFAVYLWPESGFAPLIAAVLAFLPAIASFHFLERPLRDLRPFAGRRRAGVIATVLLVPIVLSGTLGWAATSRWAPELKSADGPTGVHEGDIGQRDYLGYVRDHNHPCTPAEIREHALSWDGIVRCWQSHPGQDVAVAIIGDSHAEHLFLGLSDKFPEQNIAYYILAELPVRDSEDMTRILDHVAASDAIHTVIVSAYWDERDVPTNDLAATLSDLAVGGRDVYLTDDVPFFPFDATGCKYTRALLLRKTECVQDAELFWHPYSDYYPDIQSAVDQVPGAVMLNTAHYFCGERTCDMTVNGTLMYRDSHHLNIAGSRYVADRLADDYPALAESLTADP